MLLEVCVGHLGLLRVIVLFVSAVTDQLGGHEAFSEPNTCGPRATMEANIPSELDITHYRIGGRGDAEDAAELNHTLVSQGHTFSSGKCELVP